MFRTAVIARPESKPGPPLSGNYCVTIDSRRTGPSRPDGSSGESGLYAFQAEKVYLVVASGCRSPISRLTHALITLHGDFVRAGLQRGSGIDAVRSVPDRAEFLSVDCDNRQVFHVAEVDPEGRALLEPVGRGLDGFGVGARAGEIFHALVAAFIPRNELVERDGCGRAATGLKGTVHGPSTVASWVS